VWLEYTLVVASKDIEPTYIVNELVGRSELFRKMQVGGRRRRRRRDEKM